MSGVSSIDMDWQFTALASLSAAALYEVLQLRSAVFVVEQACVFQDMDGADADAMHLLGRQAGQLVAYARCFDAGVKYPEASIGRVVTHASARGRGAGHVLMKQAINQLHRHWGLQPIRIGAQSRLEQFYRQHGFVPSGAPYIEDAIPHIEMLRPA